ncbi:hypothetical protein A2U01_0000739, partial [Trifolium medium]|nr:hypothetical protein [Trifolium medium]
MVSEPPMFFEPVHTGYASVQDSQNFLHRCKAWLNRLKYISGQNRSKEEVHKEDEAPSQDKNETDTTYCERFIEALKKLEASLPEEEQQQDDYIYLTKECSAILTKKPQQKQEQKRDDPRILTIPYRLGMDTGLLEDIDETLILTDQSEIFPEGLIRDVPIKVNNLLMEVDFVVLDTNEDEEISIIFGRPSSAASHEWISNKQKELELRTDDKEKAHHEEEDKEEDQELLVE